MNPVTPLVSLPLECCVSDYAYFLVKPNFVTEGVTG